MSRAGSISEKFLARLAHRSDSRFVLQEIFDRQIKKPFVPFIVRLKDGRKLMVQRRGEVHPRPSLNTLLYWNKKMGGPESFDASTIVEVVKAPRRARKRRTSR